MDDAAVLGDLVFTHDVLVDGVHFRPNDPVGDVAWKLLAVNLSDLAAKGAVPVGVLLGYPLSDDKWDTAFVRGLGEALAYFDVALFGGDTVRGPRVLSLTAIGQSVHAPSRSGAKAGDALCITGVIGRAGLGLAGDPEHLNAYRRPVPRLAEGQALAPIVHAMMDVSDGLLIDAQRMAAASGLGLTIDLDAVPHVGDLMTAITAGMVKELREATGAGMMDVKKALTEVNGDMEAAVDWLRTKGLAKAAKKADRVAAEGLIGVAVSTGRGVAVEINSETDFVAKNADFQALVRDLTNVALTVGESVEVVKAAHLNGKTVDTVLQEAISRIGENMTLRRMHVLEGDTVVSYVHNAAAEGMGKIGVLVALNGPADAAQAIGKQFAMHIAATAPLSLSEATLDSAVMERELAVQTAKALEENAASAKPKPDQVIHQNIIPGRMKRFLAENTLLGQAFVINPDLTVEAAAKAAGVEITGYARVAVGEGIEKKTEDFAAEVAKALQG